ncbi:Methyltransferase domain-containing protein [Flavobacterium aquidurense]|uniref:Methyltransferase domain-containing protein n=1 Tax=Flavobacterium frigidimaris TaxID=262320 RepID=A0ABX4BVE6_FLAFR|nr:methyltransferase domain-containing protein [Flavobacterium frigidimaris]OXA81454.1 hypothetical protein B0A65_04140 [Flavobacterium frigidimaris]SDZ04909.1 Methyltransferase domain-containing protein [Flavobacterium aquidurense]
MNNTDSFRLNSFVLQSGFKRTYISSIDKIDYSDGQVEDEIFTVLCDLEDCNVEKHEYLEDQIKDWPTKYHFGWERQNILSTIKFDENDKVLELGAGTGVLTDFLVKNVEYVCSIEGTFSRGRCIEKRCFDSTNFDVIIANFLEVDLNSLFSNFKFDKILLIGVLEYIPKYSNLSSEEAIQKILNTCNQLLSENGELIIAIENKLGLKYLMGWDEDHNGQKFYSVESKYKTRNDFATFSKNEIEREIKKANFQVVNFSYPFPDYKLPSLIINESENLKNKEFKELLKNLLYEIKVPNYDLKHTIHDLNQIKFGRVLSNIIDEEILPSISNSFLIVAEKNPKQIKNNILAVYFSAQRRYKFANKILFKSQFQNMFIEKSWLYTDQDQGKNILNLNCRKDIIQDCVLGISLHVKFDNLYYINDEVAYKVLLNKWIQFLKTNLNGFEFTFDIVPFNAILSENDIITMIDVDEWEMGKKLSIAQLLYRYFILNKEHLVWLYPNIIGFENKMLELLEDYQINLINISEFHEIDILHHYSQIAIMRKPYSTSLISPTAKEITLKQTVKLVLKKTYAVFKRRVYKILK